MRPWIWVAAACAVLVAVGCGPGGRRVADAGPSRGTVATEAAAWACPVCADTASPARVFARDDVDVPAGYVAVRARRAGEGIARADTVPRGWPARCQSDNCHAPEVRLPGGNHSTLLT